jgi:hypothetical protein
MKKNELIKLLTIVSVICSFLMNTQIIGQEIKKIVSDASDGDSLGFSVSINNDFSIVGAPSKDSVGIGADVGKAYIFMRDLSDWIQLAELTAPDGGSGDNFGYSVAINGNFAIVGAPFWDSTGVLFNAGKAYIYQYDGSNWNYYSSITAGDPGLDDNFGNAVALDNNYAIVGARWDSENGNRSGAAYIFFFNGSTWDQQAKLIAADGQVSDRFGYSVSINGNFALVGARFDDDGGTNAGSAYVFERSGTTWSQQAHLEATDAFDQDNFGTSVAIYGNRILIGSPFDDTIVGSSAGSAYMFLNSGGVWTQQYKITPNDASSNDRFGHSISFYNDYTVIGTPRDDAPFIGPEAGSAYTFLIYDSSWTQKAKIIADDISSEDEYGFSVAINKGTVLVGSPFDDHSSMTDVGSVYFYNNIPGNGRPIAVGDLANTPEDTLIIINVLFNDSDPEGDSLTISEVMQGSNGGVIIYGDSTVTYSPDLNYNGVDNFTYVAYDGHGGLDTANVTVTVTAVNDRPVAVNDTAITSEDTPAIIDVLSNDSDPDGDNLTVGEVMQGSNGSVVNNGDGTVTYNPELNYNGVDNFTYVSNDGNGGLDTANVTVTITAVNDRPVAVNDTAGTSEDTPVVIDVLSNDSDPEGDGLTVSEVMQGNNGSVVNNGDGTVTYSPELNYNGVDNFTYVASDGHGGLDTANVIISVTESNDRPVTVDDTTSTPEDIPVIIDVLSNDSDPEGDSLTVSQVMQGSNGSVVNNEDGTVTFSPDLNYNGVDNFTYVASDGHGGLDTANVTVTVISSNDPPVISGSPLITFNEDDSLRYAVSNLFNFVSDPDNSDSTLNYLIYSGNTISVYQDSLEFIFKSTIENWYGSDTLMLTISDSSLSDTAELFVNVNSINDAPFFINWPDTIQFLNTSDTTLIMNDYVIDYDLSEDRLQWLFSYINDSLITQFDSLTSELTLSAPLFSGSVSIHCTVEDDSGASVDSFLIVKVIADPASIEDITDLIPDKYYLNQNFPNPFNPITKIKYGLPYASKIKFDVYNVIGQKVFSIGHDLKPAGIHFIEFEGKGLPSGIYFYHFQAKNFNEVRKMVLLK